MRVFRETKAILAESIVWRPAGPLGGSGQLLWCDITAGLLHASPLDGSVDGADDLTFAFPPPLASFHPATVGADDGFVVSLGDRVVLADGAGTIIRTLAEIAHVHPGMRMNEGKVDPLGRWVTGSMDLTTGEPDAAFYAVTPGGELSVLIGGVGVGNGLEWSEDASLVYFTDTSVNTVYRATYPGGEIVDPQPFLTDGPYDGLTRDVEGCFWAARYGEGVVQRFSAEGDVLLTVELPAPNLTSVAFGGDDLSTLFVASARENLTEQQLGEHPLSGSVFAVDTDTRGVPARTFVVPE